MNFGNNIKILCISSKTWSTANIKSLENDCFKYDIQLLSPDLEKIKYRLEHNSYDILVINYSFLKKYVSILDIFSFTKMSFAMSRPSLIICKTKFQKLYLKFLLFQSKLFLKFQSAKEFINISTEASKTHNSNIINNSLIYHQYLSKISNEIYNVFINQ